MNKPISIEKVLGACITIVVIVIMGFLVSNNKNKVDQSAGARNAPITNTVQTELDPTANIDPEVLKQAFALHAEDDTVTVTDKNGAQKMVPVPKKVFISGGSDDTGNHFDDVYSTTDGINWNNVPQAAPHWSPRAYHKMVYFKNKIWLMGMTSGGMNDIWNSSDGSNWSLVSVPVPIHTLSNMVVYGGKIYILGGFDIVQGNMIYSNDVITYDGNNWLQTSASWSPRSSFLTTVYKNKIWMFGGDINSGAISLETWSYDGTVWIPGPNVPWINNPKYTSSISVFDDGSGNKIYITGGYDNTGTNQLYNEVWTFNGTVFNQKNNLPSGSNFGNSFTLNNSLYQIGGQDPSSVTGVNSNVLLSNNGNSWQVATSTPGWSPRFIFAAVKVPITFGQKPDLVSWDIQWKDSPDPNASYSQIPISKQYNNPVSFMITIKNNGTADAVLPSNTVMRLYKDSITQANIVGEFNTGITPYTITTGVGMDFYFNSTKNASNLATLGTHNFILYADKTNKLDELDETNNTLTTSFSMVP